MITPDHWAMWNQTLAAIIDADFNDNTLATLVSALENIVQGSSSTVMVYPPEQRPTMYHHQLLQGEDPAIHIDQYLDGAYLVDPYYLISQEQTAEGVFTINDVAPQGFEHCEYYRVYYHAVDLLDEACFILQDILGYVVIISLGRHSSDNYFNAEDKSLLQSLLPVVKAVIKKWAGTSTPLQREQSIRPHLDSALNTFGSSLLTKRECQIINRILRGHSIKSISQHLGNSVETIKHHRKNIYLKLGVNSQAELFYLFIDSLRSCPQEINKDPLITYLPKKG